MEIFSNKRNKKRIIVLRAIKLVACLLCYMCIWAPNIWSIPIDIWDICADCAYICMAVSSFVCAN